eukprot:gene19025-45884_t
MIATQGLEICNAPAPFSSSGIPNWCTLKAENGSVAWDLMPRLAAEMHDLFGGEEYHIGGDETRHQCGGACPFERMLLERAA